MAEVKKVNCSLRYIFISYYYNIIERLTIVIQKREINLFTIIIKRTHTSIRLLSTIHIISIVH